MLKIEKIPEQMEIMQLSKELSNDVCMEVRKAAASQMDKIIKSLNKKYISGTYLFAYAFLSTRLRNIF